VLAQVVSFASVVDQPARLSWGAGTLPVRNREYTPIM
jgi:hypothetical protein